MKILWLAILLSSFASAQSSHWEYHAPRGPAQWGNMPGNELCTLGVNQSPIAIETGRVAGLSNVTPDNTLPPLGPAWRPSPLQLVNNGHTIQVVYEKGSFLTFEEQAFELKQFHFHSPSEHILDERQYPLEVHFVHAREDGSLLVVGVFFKEGGENAMLGKIWDNAPDTPGEKKVPKPGEKVNALAFMPAKAEFYTYSGSLTTPPCSENVRWIVMAQPIEASSAQLRFLQAKLGTTNNRPVQTLDGRVIREENH